VYFHSYFFFNIIIITKDENDAQIFNFFLMHLFASIFSQLNLKSNSNIFEFHSNVSDLYLKLSIQLNLNSIQGVYNVIQYFHSNEI